MKRLFSPLFLLAQDARAELTSSTNPGRGAEMCSEQDEPQNCPCQREHSLRVTKRRPRPTETSLSFKTCTHGTSSPGTPRPHPRELTLKGILLLLLLSPLRPRAAGCRSTVEAGRTLTGCSEEGVHQLVAVLASRVRQAAGRQRGSVLQ